MPRVTTIPATKNKFTALPTASIAKRRTAAYARVSTDSDEQFTSYEAQIDYYTKFIQARDDWEFVKVYTDVDRPYGLNPTPAGAHTTAVSGKTANKGKCQTMISINSCGCLP